MLGVESSAVLKYLESDSYGVCSVKGISADLMQSVTFVRLGLRELVEFGLVKRVVLPADYVPGVFRKRLKRLFEVGGGEMGSGTGGFRVLQKEEWFCTVSFWNQTMDEKLPEGSRGVVEVERVV